MKKSFVVLLHIGFWLCYFILAAIILAVYYRTNVNAVNQLARIMNALKTLLLFAFLPSVISYTLYYTILFPKYLQQKKYLQSLVWGLVISGGAAVAAYVLLRYFIETGSITDMDNGGKNGRSTAPLVIVIMTAIGGISGIVAFVIRGSISWFNEMKMKELLREKNYEMEMALVKSQLDPHLLFNTINNIDALILRDAVTASDYLNKLSDIMRFILYETKTDKILLSREVEYIEKYIDLQKIRTANPNYVDFKVTGSPAGKYLAPMVLIPFMENAFKHTNNKKLDHAIRIHIVITEETTQLECENKTDLKIKSTQDEGGLGNMLIEKRLNLMYPGTHRLEVFKTSESYKINLHIPNG